MHRLCTGLVWKIPRIGGFEMDGFFAGGFAGEWFSPLGATCAEEAAINEGLIGDAAIGGDPMEVTNDGFVETDGEFGFHGDSIADRRVNCQYYVWTHVRTMFMIFVTWN
jgi:hypothetical protein